MTTSHETNKNECVHHIPLRVALVRGTGRGVWTAGRAKSGARASAGANATAMVRVRVRASVSESGELTNAMHFMLKYAKVDHCTHRSFHHRVCSNMLHHGGAIGFTNTCRTEAIVDRWKKG